MENTITFQSHPDVIIGSNTFRNVPTILQYEDTPLLEVGKFEPVGYTTRFAVFDDSGVKIAVVEGGKITVTPEGAKARITCRHEPDLTVCELEGKPILELRRRGTQALNAAAELYAPEGVLIKANVAEASAILQSGRPLLPGAQYMSNSTFCDGGIAFHVRRDGIAIGVGCRSIHIGERRIGPGRPGFPTFG